MSKPAADRTSPEGPYTEKVRCAKRGCKRVRYVKKQDVFQVKLCSEHQAEAAKARRSAAAKARRAKAANTQPKEAS